eukprot:2999376-Lingulodinium_polyedra.AAC.1
MFVAIPRGAFWPFRARTATPWQTVPNHCTRTVVCARALPCKVLTHALARARGRAIAQRMGLGDIGTSSGNGPGLQY